MEREIIGELDQESWVSGDARTSFIQHTQKTPVIQNL